MWSEVPLDQLGYVSRGRSRHRPRNDPVLYGGVHPFIQTGDVKAAGLRITTHSQTYGEAGLAQSRLWPENTLCITIAANIGDTALLSYPACFPDSIIGFVGDERKCDVRFVKYCFDMVQERMRMVSQGATQDNLSQDKLLRFGIPCPPVETQTAIGDMLSAYDDLIETNRRRIALLEESARLLYREWFVNLRFPGCSNMSSSADVPHGWKRCSLGDLATLHYGKALKDANRIAGHVLVYGSSGVVGEHNRALVDGPAIIVGRKGNVGSVYYSHGPCFPIDTVYFVRGNEVSYFLYLLLETMDFISSDSAVPGLNRSHACRLPVTCPSKEALHRFEEVVAQIFEQIHVLQETNKKTAAARDQLLPKLMSGAIRV